MKRMMLGWLGALAVGLGPLPALAAADYYLKLDGVEGEIAVLVEIAQVASRDFARRLDRSGLSAKLGANLFLEQPVRLTSTALAVRRAYQLIPGPCETCPHRAAFPAQRAPV